MAYNDRASPLRNSTVNQRCQSASSINTVAHAAQSGAVQVCSGCFPRISRNLGTGEPLDSDSTEMHKAHQALPLGSIFQSELILPLVRADTTTFWCVG